MMNIRNEIKRRLDAPRLTIWFCAFCLIFGIPLVFLYPPFLASDEIAHFYRAYQVSEFRLFSDANGQEGGGILPSSLTATVDVVKENMLDIPGFTLESLKDIPRIPLAPHDRTWTAFTGSALYSPLPYLPQALGILIGRVFNSTPLTLHYFARICSLLTWALMGMLALKTIPIYKNVLFILMLSPLVFSKAVVVTADVVTVGACALLVCQALKIACGEQNVTRGDVTLLFIYAALVGFCKIVYAPLAALCFLIPIKRLGSRKRFWLICGGAIIIAFAANFLWMFCLAGNLPIRTNTSAQPGVQVGYILSHPLSFVKVVWRYTYEYLWPNFQSIFGSLIVWREVWLPAWVIALLWAAVLFAAIMDKPAYDLRLWKKAGVLAVVLCEYVLIIASLYVSFSTPMATRVQGMQARYMFPLMLPFLLIFKRKKAGQFNASAVCVPVSFVSLFVLIIAMYSRFKS